MVFLSTWMLGLGSFVRQYMADPVVMITSPLEAAVYARIKWVRFSNCSLFVCGWVDFFDLDAWSGLVCVSVHAGISCCHDHFPARSDCV